MAAFTHFSVLYYSAWILLNFISRQKRKKGWKAKMPNSCWTGGLLCCPQQHKMRVTPACVRVMGRTLGKRAKHHATVRNVNWMQTQVLWALTHGVRQRVWKWIGGASPCLGWKSFMVRRRGKAARRGLQPPRMACNAAVQKSYRLIYHKKNLVQITGQPIRSYLKWKEKSIHWLPESQFNMATFVGQRWPPPLTSLLWRTHKNVYSCKGVHHHCTKCCHLHFHKAGHYSLRSKIY